MDKELNGQNTKILAATLEQRDVSRDTFLGIILQIQSETQAKEMCEWLEANPKATQRRMIQAAMKISRNLSHHRKINVIGIGGAGCNAVGRLHEKHIDGITCVLINSDSVLLEERGADFKIHIGSSIQGKVLDTTPELWEGIAETREHEIRNVIENAEFNIIVCRMGGNIGTGVSPVVARISEKLKIPTAAIVTIPFEFEGKKGQENANLGIKRLSKYIQDIVVIESDKVIEGVEIYISCFDAFDSLDIEVIDSIKHMAICWALQNPMQPE